MIEVDIDLFEYMFYNLFVEKENLGELRDRVYPYQARIILKSENLDLQQVLKMNTNIYNELIKISREK